MYMIPYSRKKKKGRILQRKLSPLRIPADPRMHTNFAEGRNAAKFAKVFSPMKVSGYTVPITHEAKQTRSLDSAVLS